MRPSPLGGELERGRCVVRILLVRLTIGHIAVREDKDLAEVVGVVIATIPVRPEAQVVVARHQGEFGQVSAICLKRAELCVVI